MKGLMYIFFHITKVQAPFTLKEKNNNKEQKNEEATNRHKKKRAGKKGKKIKNLLKFIKLPTENNFIQDLTNGYPFLKGGGGRRAQGPFGALLSKKILVFNTLLAYLYPLIKE